jgi:acyl carrier protein
MHRLEQELRTYIATSFLLSEDATAVAGTQSLTRGGVIDSIGIVELRQFVESNYGITILDEETTPENFDTIDSIVRYVGTKLSAADVRA